ncbi:uncharacterized protein A4U43_C06F4450 [Asparagus officinalis]|uniref:Glucan endo-1,3-beta-D-glucosidase n=1 Tax=Asparagus officinalis TaxID=4686 RepID=A0A5P1EQ12_ASPOF|nr:uncharacterized protein A4U43_C06F4450 [Asparagus officinalis]
MQNLQNALLVSLPVKVSTVNTMAVLAASEPPSAGAFHAELLPSLQGIFGFLQKNRVAVHDKPVPVLRLPRRSEARTPFAVDGGDAADAGKSVDTYIFALYDEDLKPGPVSERSFGLFHPDLSMTSDVGLKKSSSSGSSQGLGFVPAAWLVT